MARFTGQAGLPLPARLHPLVLQAEGRVRLEALRVYRMPQAVSPERHADIQGLARILQQPRCGARVRSPREDAGVLLQQRHRHLERRRKPSRRQPTLPAARRS